MPHDRCIVIVTPMPSAPPPGIVLATAVDARFPTAASRRRSPGCTAVSIGQYEAMFHAATASSGTISNGVIAVMVSQTAP